MTLMQMKPIEIWRTPVFNRWAEKVWTDDEYVAFREFIAAHPEAGQIVVGTGGVRKIRWGRAGLGKSKGTRVIYYFMNAARPLYLLMGYSKSDKVDMSQADREWAKAMVRIIKEGKWR